MCKFVAWLSIVVALSVPVRVWAQAAGDDVPPDPLLAGVQQEMDSADAGPDRVDSVFADRDSGTSAGKALGKTLAALCLVLALCFGLFYAARRWGKGVPMLAGPSLAKVLGRIHLDRGTALHFVRIGDRVLVIGVNGSAITNLADFSASVFEKAGGEDGNGEAAFNPDSFLAELQQHSLEMRQSAGLPRADEDEIASLRGDIQRLQRYLRDENREPAE